MLADAGLREIEATSFVSARAIPQLADADELMRGLERRHGVRYPGAGAERSAAWTARSRPGADAICLFTAATERYARHNINMSVDESLAAFAPIAAAARRARHVDTRLRQHRIRLPVRRRGRRARGGRRRRSGCWQLGVDELSISDTVGAAVPADVRRVLGALAGAGHRPAASPAISTTREGRRWPT